MTTLKTFDDFQMIGFTANRVFYDHVSPFYSTGMCSPSMAQRVLAFVDESNFAIEVGMNKRENGCDMSAVMPHDMIERMDKLITETRDLPKAIMMDVAAQ